MSCKHGYIGDAKMLNLFRNISWLSFIQSLMNVCILIWRVVISCVHILLLPTHVTFHRSLRLAPWCFASTLVYKWAGQTTLKYNWTIEGQLPFHWKLSYQPLWCIEVQRRPSLEISLLWTQSRSRQFVYRVDIGNDEWPVEREKW